MTSRGSYSSLVQSGESILEGREKHPHPLGISIALHPLLQRAAGRHTTTEERNGMRNVRKKDKTDVPTTTGTCTHFPNHHGALIFAAVLESKHFRFVFFYRSLCLSLSYRNLLTFHSIFNLRQNAKLLRFSSRCSFKSRG
ncbi:hypothetical protein CDAR_18571 [Caerostris darwini]|uniref:Uncharacterized protein n=1 Tax=Caerostris darwini TaxID=1538125 RepID=A0AAV4VA42_9ARAC|nr:hypothetical protein CDAR_18571 [Caerostris darwini]